MGGSPLPQRLCSDKHVDIPKILTVISNISFSAALYVNFVYAKNSWMFRILHEPLPECIVSLQTVQWWTVKLKFQAPQFNLQFLIAISSLTSLLRTFNARNQLFSWSHSATTPLDTLERKSFEIKWQMADLDKRSSLPVT